MGMDLFLVLKEPSSLLPQCSSFLNLLGKPLASFLSCQYSSHPYWSPLVPSNCGPFASPSAYRWWLIKLSLRPQSCTSSSCSPKPPRLFLTFLSFPTTFWTFFHQITRLIRVWMLTKAELKPPFSTFILLTVKFSFCNFRISKLRPFLSI